MFKKIYYLLFISFYLAVFDASSSIDDGVGIGTVLPGRLVSLECRLSDPSDFHKTFHIKLLNPPKTIGWMEVSDRNKTPYLVWETLMIHPEHQKKGYGTDVASIIFEKYRPIFKNFALCVDPYNIGAIRLYERLGFREVHQEIPGIFVCTGAEILMITNNQ